MAPTTRKRIHCSNTDHERILSAAANGDLEYLMNNINSNTTGVGLKKPTDVVCKSGCTALHWAAGCNQMSVVEYLVVQLNWNVNMPCRKKSAGRTPLHYACRNGCFEMAQFLVKTLSAQVNVRAKHGVTPFQLAIFKNHLKIAQWLVESCGIVACQQINDFGCSPVHWLGICSPECADDDNNSKSGAALIPMAMWLATLPGIDYKTAKQNTGHTALHKASWLGHLALVEYLHVEHDMWDDQVDDAGNYAADLADMANTPRHALVAEYLRVHCSRQRHQSCAVLQVPSNANQDVIRQAYKAKLLQLHPDKRQHGDNTLNVSNDDFCALQRAYKHLVVEKGRGTQSNPAHSLRLMIKVNACNDVTINNDHKDDEEEDDMFFKARLVAVVLEYGDKGLDLSNLKKKWKQVWPDTIFPEPNNNNKNKRRIALSKWIGTQASDVIEIRKDNRDGIIRLFPKHCSQGMVQKAAEAAACGKKYGVGL